MNDEIKEILDNMFHIIMKYEEDFEDLAKNDSQIAKYNIDRADYYRKIADSYCLRLKQIKKYCKNNIQYYNDEEYQGEDCCCDGFVILKIIGDDINE